ncbi:MAG: type II toxin-antitoxin system PemK/MazF family toxin [Arachnia sp.]
MASRDSVITAGIRLLRQVAGRALASPSTSRRVPAAQTDAGYPGDYTQRPHIVYDPYDDDLPDPGEVIWAWVPYEEDHTQGKDRPALVIGRDGQWLLVLHVTSQDHDRDADQEARVGRYWVDIGTGEWDRRRRPSEARVNRIIRIDPGQVRRIGAVLDRDHFDAVARAVLQHY